MMEKPILFSRAMVRAILEGAKTQTRRVVKLTTGRTFDERALQGAIQEWRPVFDPVAGRIVGDEAAIVRCPYGKRGDTLWVRETWADCTKGADALSGTKYDAPWYRADADEYGLLGYDGIGPVYVDDLRWRPSIHMPRRFSRLTLRVTDVRVERLQEISEADAIAEGVDAIPQSDVPRQATWSRRQDFAQLWDSINGKTYPWESNPWVWVVEFERA